eukprot:9251832-Pyramimonas_sp.AAC.2
MVSGQRRAVASYDGEFFRFTTLVVPYGVSTEYRPSEGRGAGGQDAAQGQTSSRTARPSTGS